MDLGHPLPIVVAAHCVIHLTFVASGVLLAVMDWIAGKARALHEGHDQAGFSLAQSRRGQLPSYSAQQSGVSKTRTAQSCGSDGAIRSQIDTAMFSAVGFSRTGMLFRQW